MIQKYLGYQDLVRRAVGEEDEALVFVKSWADW